MSIVVYIESQNGIIKKAGLEVASYGRAMANTLNSSLSAVVFNADDVSTLSNYGVDKVLSVKITEDYNAETYADILKQAVEREQSKVIVLSSSADCKYLAPLLSFGLDAGYVPNVLDLPESTAPFQVKRSVFTNKAFSKTEIS